MKVFLGKKITHFWNLKKKKKKKKNVINGQHLIYQIIFAGEKGVITFSRLFLIGSSLYLQVSITYIRACMSSKFGRIRPRTMELAALERRKKFP